MLQWRLQVRLWQQGRGSTAVCCTGKLISDLGSATWKHRNAAVEQVEGIIKAAGNRIQTSTGGLLPALKVCLHKAGHDGHRCIMYSRYSGVVTCQAPDFTAGLLDARTASNDRDQA